MTEKKLLFMKDGIHTTAKVTFPTERDIEYIIPYDSPHLQNMNILIRGIYAHIEGDILVGIGMVYEDVTIEKNTKVPEIKQTSLSKDYEYIGSVYSIRGNRNYDIYDNGKSFCLLRKGNHSYTSLSKERYNRVMKFMHGTLLPSPYMELVDRAESHGIKWNTFWVSMIIAKFENRITINRKGMRSYIGLRVVHQ